ncbi:hypothetical protein KCP71_10945 [Salmonella enterica subsp. enterica]|nr:hypothetical protein KCP71_10945 [Salmonella enterica subsp. enterica]
MNRKGLYLHAKFSYSVAPSRTTGLETKAAQSISRKVACLHNRRYPNIWPFTARWCPPDKGMR